MGLWSGCIGIGFESLASAFYAQEGVELDTWPRVFCKSVGGLPGRIRFL